MLVGVQKSTATFKQFSSFLKNKHTLTVFSELNVYVPVCPPPPFHVLKPIAHGVGIRRLGPLGGD